MAIADMLMGRPISTALVGYQKWGALGYGEDGDGHCRLHAARIFRGYVERVGGFVENLAGVHEPNRLPCQPKTDGALRHTDGCRAGVAMSGTAMLRR